jgi:hypothetical protein
VTDSADRGAKRSEVAQSVDESDSREVLDHMVRLEFDVNEDQQAATNIFSFYGHYYDYLEEYNLIEVSFVNFS